MNIIGCMYEYDMIYRVSFYLFNIYLYNRVIDNFKVEAMKISDDLNNQNKNNENWEKLLKMPLKRSKIFLATFNKESLTITKIFNEYSSDLFESIYKNKNNNNNLIANKEVSKYI